MVDRSGLNSLQIYGVPCLTKCTEINEANTRLALFSFVEAFHHYAQAYDDCQECEDSQQEPPEHTGVILMTEIKYKLPKPGHLGLGHALYKHDVHSLAILPGASPHYS